MSVWRVARAARAARAAPRLRPFCSGPDSSGPVRKKKSPGCRLMEFSPVFLPSLFHSARNWLVTQFLIKPHLDPEFDIKKFIDGSKQAVQAISNSLSESDFGLLKELVSEDAYKELSESVKEMSVAEREELSVVKEDIYLCFPYQIGLMFEDDERRWVEITMVYHTVRGLQEYKESYGNPPPDHQAKVQICNYRFIREYTKGITQNDWVVNIVNHFNMKDYQS